MSKEREPLPNQSAVDRSVETGGEVVTLQHGTLDEIKDLMSQASIFKGSTHTLSHFDAELNVGLNASYTSGSEERLHIGIYTPNIIHYLVPRYDSSWESLETREPALLEALKRDQRLRWNDGWGYWQQIKDEFIGALDTIGVIEVDELSNRLQHSIKSWLGLPPGRGLSSESDLHGFGWVMKGAEIETVETAGNEIRGGQSWPGMNPRFDVKGIPSEQTGQVLKGLLAQALAADT